MLQGELPGAKLEGEIPTQLLKKVKKGGTEMKITVLNTVTTKYGYCNTSMAQIRPWSSKQKEIFSCQLDSRCLDALILSAASLCEENGEFCNRATEASYYINKKILSNDYIY